MTEHTNNQKIIKLKDKNEKPEKNPLDNDDLKDQAIIEALHYYLRERALTQNVHLPRWASW